MTNIRNLFLMLTSDFQNFYLGTWIFITLMHGFTLLFYFGGGHTVITAVFSVLMVLVGAWEIRALALWDKKDSFLASDINSEGLVVIVVLHLLFAGIHYMGNHTHPLFEVRWYWLFAAVAVCKLMWRIDIDPKERSH